MRQQYIEVSMNLESHLKELKRKHFELDETIFREEKKRAPFFWEIRRLKKQKLNIKDRIEKLTQKL
ncbi:MAG: YdcH family protein [Pseudomonadota bacterium]|nr:YdcH family protein [Pseudomonadota bacterium]